MCVSGYIFGSMTGDSASRLPRKNPQPRALARTFMTWKVSAYFSTGTTTTVSPGRPGSPLAPSAPVGPAGPGTATTGPGTVTTRPGVPGTPAGPGAPAGPGVAITTGDGGALTGLQALKPTAASKVASRKVVFMVVPGGVGLVCTNRTVSGHAALLCAIYRFARRRCRYLRHCSVMDHGLAGVGCDSGDSAANIRFAYFCTGTTTMVSPVLPVRPVSPLAPS